jgi:hypothetical protein
MGKGARRALMVPRAVALEELNMFLELPEAITDEELKEALRANSWSDHRGGR